MTQEQDDEPLFIFELSKRALDPTSIRARKCFLCGKDASSGDGEHVVPRWLQKRFDLRDKQITLLNGSRLPYRQLTIPACNECNTQTLSNTERKIAELSQAEASAVSLSDRFEIGRWMSKILIGILIKETSLLTNRQDSSEGNIFPAEDLGELLTLHLFIQAWRKRCSYRCLHAEHPFTLYVYGIEEDERFGRFDLSTNLLGKSLCIRMDKLAFAFVGDGGLQHEVGKLGPFDLAGQTLHPAQFYEIASRVHYKASLRDATHSYLNKETAEDLTFEQGSVVPFSAIRDIFGNERIFREWDEQELAQFHRHYRVPYAQQLLDADGAAAYTFLVDENSNRLDLKAITSK